jgi:hypothetical protein
VSNNDDTELETRLIAELGERRDWWLLAGGKIYTCEQRGAVIRWKFSHGCYEAWFVDDVWRIRLPDGNIIFTRRWQLQSVLWRAILHRQKMQII